MSERFATAFALQDILIRARASRSEIYDRWCRVGARLADHRSDPIGHAKEHLDGYVDLVLRELEADQFDAIKKHGVKIDGGAMFLQVSLSKMWVLATYETVRLNCSFKSCAALADMQKYCGADGCLRCRLKLVRDRLNTFRVPLAKLEPETLPRTNPSRTSYQPELVIDEDNGSMGWRVLSDRTSTTQVDSRLALSDLVLEKLS